jgi:hypothetical protein
MYSSETESEMLCQLFSYSNKFNIINIFIIVGFNRATRSCAARTRLFRLIYMTNMALRAPPSPPPSIAVLLLLSSSHVIVSSYLIYWPKDGSHAF